MLDRAKSRQPRRKEATFLRRTVAALKQERDRLRRLLDLHQQERQLVGYEIHDGLAQHLAAAAMHFEGLGAWKTTMPATVAQAVEAGLQQLDQGLRESRRLIGELRPRPLEGIGLIGAIQGLIDETVDDGIKAEVVTEGDWDRLPSPLQHNVFRIVQQALGNARRHSQSRRVGVSLERDHEEGRVEIRDWGIGFATGEIRKGCFGLEGIRRRAELCGGSVSIASSHGKGTRIVMRFPWREE
jgi:two-component system, NarL family, sensor histidine kinase DegS